MELHTAAGLAVLRAVRLAADLAADLAVLEAVDLQVPWEAQATSSLMVPFNGIG